MGEAKRRRNAAENAGRIFTRKDGGFNWTDTAHPRSPCPFCDAPLDRASSPEGYHPSPGNFTVCLVCTQILIFKQDLSLRGATVEELKKLDEQHPRFANKMRLMQRAARLVDRQRSARG